MRSQSVRLKHPLKHVNELEKGNRIFDPSTDMFHPIKINSENAAYEELEKLQRSLYKDVDWEDQVTAIKRGISLVNGGILNYSKFVDNLKIISAGLTEAFLDQRSGLVKWSCIFICQLAVKLGSNFVKMGDILSDLSKRTNNGTSAIAEACKYTMSTIIDNCCSKLILLTTCNLAASKNFENRQIAADGFKSIFKYWNKKIVKAHSDEIIKKLHVLVKDPNQDVRITSREASKIFIVRYEKLSKQFTDNLERRILHEIEKLEYIDDDDESESDDLNIRKSSPKKNTKITKSHKPRKSSLPAEDELSAFRTNSKKSKTSRYNGNLTYGFTKKNYNKKLENKAELNNDPVKFLIEEKKPIRESKIPLKYGRMNASSEEDYSQLSQSVRLSKIKRDCSEKKGISFKPKNDRLIRYESISPKTKKRSSSVQDHSKAILSFAEEISNEDSKLMPPPKLAKDNEQHVQKPSKKITSPISGFYSPPLYIKHLNILKYSESVEDMYNFLREVEKESSKRDTSSMETHITSVISGLVYCYCKSTDTANTEKSQKLILKLIPRYTNQFEPFLCNILDIILINIPNSNQIDNTTKNIIKTIQKCYSPNLLINKATSGELTCSSHLIRFLLPIIQKDKADLRKTDTCVALLKLALPLVKKDKESVSSLLSVISLKNKKSINAFKLKEKNENLIQYLHELQNEEKYMDIIPIIDIDNIEKTISDIAFCFNEVDKIVLKSVKPLLYKKITQFISTTPDCDIVFGLIETIIEKYGYEHFEIFLPDLLKFRDSFRFSKPRFILDQACNRIDEITYMNYFIKILKSENEIDIENCLKELEYLYTSKMLRLSGLTESISVTAVFLIAHENPKVRQRVVSFLASLVVLFGNETIPSYKKLEEPSRRLVDFYVNKKQKEQ